MHRTQGEHVSAVILVVTHIQREQVGVSWRQVLRMVYRPFMMEIGYSGRDRCVEKNIPEGQGVYFLRVEQYMVPVGVEIDCSFLSAFIDTERPWEEPHPFGN